MRLRLKYTNDNESFVVTGVNDPTHMYGVGITGSEAIDDYVDALIEYTCLDLRASVMLAIVPFVLSSMANQVASWERLAIQWTK